MIRHILDALRRRRGEQEPARLARPNELRRDVVQAERRQREATLGTLATGRGSRFPPASEEERAPRKAPPALAEPRPVSRQHALGQVLRTRSGLRAAWLAKEVLGPPPALRGMRDDIAP